MIYLHVYWQKVHNTVNTTDLTTWNMIKCVIDNVVHSFYSVLIRGAGRPYCEIRVVEAWNDDFGGKASRELENSTFEIKWLHHNSSVFHISFGPTAQIIRLPVLAARGQTVLVRSGHEAKHPSNSVTALACLAR